MNKDIIPYNNLGQKHGYWEIYNDNGLPRRIGTYKNGIANGCFKYYSLTGAPLLFTNLINGKNIELTKNFCWNTNKLRNLTYNII